ncbi:hypothetical protein ABIA39_000720 [Nocardia sp. GAS34]
MAPHYEALRRPLTWCSSLSGRCRPCTDDNLHTFGSEVEAVRTVTAVRAHLTGTVLALGLAPESVTSLTWPSEP